MKKLLKVLLLSFAFIGVFAASTANTYASAPGATFSNYEGEEYFASSGVYKIKSPGQQYVNLYNLDSQTPLFSADDYGLLINTTVNLIFADSEGTEYVVTPGEYRITSPAQEYLDLFEVGNETRLFYTDDIGFTLRFADNLRPAISGQENFVTNINDPKDVAYFQSFLSAFDETDGDVTNRITVKTDNYTANRSVLGTHQIIFAVTDLSGNENTLTVYVRVVDVDAPVISGNTSIAQIGYKETWNINAFKSTLSVTDNYDSLTNADITIKTDNYTENKNKLGTYDVVFSATDSSGNEATLTKQVRVIDNIKPTFSGPTTIATSNVTIITESQIRSQLTAHDEIDGNITTKIQLVTDNFTGQGNKVGTYTIVYAVTDNAGNTEQHTVSVTRSDEMPPIFWIEDGVSIKVEPTIALTKQQIIDTLTASGQIQVTATTQVSFLFNEYEGNESVPGIYAISMRVADLKGNEEIHNIAVTVLDTEDDDDQIVLEPKEPIIKLPDWAPEWATEYQEEILIGLSFILLIGVLIIYVGIKKKSSKTSKNKKNKK